MRKAVVGWSALLAVWVFSVSAYSELPELVVVRWNLEFEPSGYASRFVAAVIMPSAFLLAPLVAWILPRVDPRRASYRRHESTYWLIWNAVMLLLAVLQALTIGIALGWRIDAARAFPSVIGLVFIVLGNYLPRLRPNWFVGIRTPWTLSSDEVWRRTHRLGSRTMIVCGVLLLLAGFDVAEWVRTAAWVVALLVGVGLPVVYSFVVWRSLGRAEGPGRSAL